MPLPVEIRKGPKGRVKKTLAYFGSDETGVVLVAQVVPKQNGFPVYLGVKWKDVPQFLEELKNEIAKHSP